VRPLVLVDARNVLRSRWPNIPAQELVELVRAWADAEQVEVLLVFDGKAPEAPEAVGTGCESADDWLVRKAGELRAASTPFWLVTSDRALRTSAGEGAERVVGGGTFAAALGRAS
jgi:hypothetical protein